MEVLKRWRLLLFVICSAVVLCVFYLDYTDNIVLMANQVMLKVNTKADANQNVKRIQTNQDDIFQQPPTSDTQSIRTVDSEQNGNSHHETTPQKKTDIETSSRENISSIISGHEGQDITNVPSVQQEPDDREHDQDKTTTYTADIVDTSSDGTKCSRMNLTNFADRIGSDGIYQELIPRRIWIMTAHRDIKLPERAAIVVFGLVNKTEPDPRNNVRLICQLRNTNGKLVASVATMLQKLCDFGFVIESFQMICNFSIKDYRPNLLLSVVVNECDNPQVVRNINDLLHTYRAPVNYTVCICGPVKFQYADYRRFIEWMEMNAILGTERTIIYHISADPVIEKLYQYYIAKSRMEVYYSNPPYIVGDTYWINKKKEDWGYPKISMRHDCMMREMHRSRYIVLIDLDETIVPRLEGDYTWDDMVKSGGCEDRSYVMARNVFFHNEEDLDPIYAKNYEVAQRYRLWSLLTTQRSDYFYPSMKRSKNMLKPEDVVIANTHRAWISEESGEHLCALDPKYGAMHHYKYRKENRPMVQDRTMHKYSKELLARVRLVYKEIGKLLPFNPDGLDNNI